MTNEWDWEQVAQTIESTDNNGSESKPPETRTVQNAVELITEDLQQIPKIQLYTDNFPKEVFSQWINFMVAQLSGDTETAKEAITSLQDRLPQIQTAENTTQDNSTDESQQSLNTFNQPNENAQDSKKNSSLDEQIRKAFTDAAVTLIEKTHTTESDILGAMHKENNYINEDLSQNFTPAFISDMMVQQTIKHEDIQKHAGVELHQPLKIAEPSCGSGQFLVSISNHLSNVSDPPPTVIVAQDIDPLAVKMAVINSTILGLSGYVIEGDTLLNECNTLWRVGLGSPTIPDTSPHPVAEINPEVAPDALGSFAHDGDSTLNPEKIDHELPDRNTIASIQDVTYFDTFTPTELTHDRGMYTGFTDHFNRTSPHRWNNIEQGETPDKETTELLPIFAGAINNDYKNLYKSIASKNTDNTQLH